MREIKFRGKNFCGSLVYGDLRHDRMCMPDGRLKEYISVCGEPVSPKSVGQYTGKKDVNKKEIFEDDVVYFLDDRAHERIGVIKWHEKGCCWTIDCGEAGRDMLANYACEIRGNVHDNPGLLRLTKK